MANIDPFVDILTVIDAQRLMDDHPDASPDTVSSLGSDPGEYVYMLVTRAEVIGIEAGYELNVAVKTGDLVRWRATSLTRNTGLSTLLYHVETHSSPLISPPASSLTRVTIPAAVGDDPSRRPTTQPYYDFFFQTTAQDPGSPGSHQVAYQLYFMLLDEQGHTVGRFSWDPFLTISRS